jgi:hypothetical protein
VDGVPTAVGGESPFAGGNQDVFLFREHPPGLVMGDRECEDKVGGEPVLRYDSLRARQTWPKEVIPVRGWRKQQPALFGGCAVNCMPAEETDWYLTQCFGPRWKTHDGQGNALCEQSLQCLWPSHGGSSSVCSNEDSGPPSPLSSS